MLGWSNSFNTASGRCCCNSSYADFIESVFVSVSIPQAVGAVATAVVLGAFYQPNENSFNTASGRYCCSIRFVFPSLWSWTRDVRSSSSLCSSAASHPSSHTASGRCSYNTLTKRAKQFTKLASCFNTTSGKCCCNVSKNLH